MNGYDERTPRRGWLIALARYFALSGIGLLAWNLVARSRGSCFRFTLPCEDCRLLAGCRLPRARVAKHGQQPTKVTP